MAKVNLKEKLGSSSATSNTSSETIVNKTMDDKFDNAKITINQSVSNSNITQPPKKTKKQLFQKKENPLKKISHKAIKQETKIDYKDFDDELLLSTVEAEEIENKNEKKKNVINKISQIVIIILCVYLIFLIYGTINTQYIYNEKGEVVPQTMTVQNIKDCEAFKSYASQYRQARSLYEQVLVLDYRLAAGEEDPLTIAPEYDLILDSINNLSLQVQALDLPSNYTQNVTMLTAWVQNDIAIYCQSMSKAISQNNAESASIALQYRNAMYNDFSTITMATISMGEQTVGTDISDIREWSPEKFIQEKIGGVISNGQ